MVSVHAGEGVVFSRSGRICVPSQSVHNPKCLQLTVVPTLNSKCKYLTSRSKNPTFGTSIGGALPSH